MARLPSLLVAAALIIPAVAGDPVRAQSSQASLDQPARKAIVEWVNGELADNYLFPEVAERMKIYLDKQLAAGHYDEYSDRQEFARALTRDLQEVSEDGHVKVLVNTDPPPPESSSDVQQAVWNSKQMERDRQENFHFKKVEHLPGNVGYLRFDKFDDPRVAGPTAVAAMNFLSDCDALIIDLRYNGGGHTTMGQLLLSYFFDEPVHTMTDYVRNTDKTEQEWTYAYVDGPKLLDTDLYVLTGGKYTYSAAEHFAFALKNQERATIIGETTSGGAHYIAFHYHREAGLELRVAIGRGFDPETGKDWEGVGVEPDVWTVEDKALDTAHTLALKNLYEKAQGERRVALQWMWEYNQARFDPVAVDAATLSSYEGQYGPLRVAVNDGRLQVLVPGEDRFQGLSALSETLFVIDGDDRFRGEFASDDQGAVVALDALMADGSKRRYPRVN